MANYAQSQEKKIGEVVCYNLKKGRITMKARENKFGRFLRLLPAAMAMAMSMWCGSAAFAQNSLPAPGSGGSFTPNNSPSPGGPANGIGWNPGPAFPGNWGSPWNNDWNNSPTIIVNSTPVIPNQGVTKVVACGYDSEGIWRVIPLTVSFQYNGVQYDVYVLNAWNPWTDTWDRGVDLPAYNTSYYIHGQEYDFYCVLPTGTYYFNL